MNERETTVLLCSLTIRCSAWVGMVKVAYLASVTELSMADEVYASE